MHTAFATAGHAAEIKSLLSELGYESDHAGITRRIKRIRQKGGEVILALNPEKEVVGCVHVFVDLRLAEGEMGEIVSLVVKQQYRGQGIGKGLVEAALNWITRQGCGTARVRANSIRQDAHTFYESRGFKLQKAQKVFQMEIDL